MTPEAADLVGCMERCSAVMEEEFPRLRKKPLLGGPFGMSGFYVASMTATNYGLDQVVYFVFGEGGLFFSMADERAEAIAKARQILTNLGTQANPLLAAFKAKQQARNLAIRQRIAEADAEVEAMRRQRHKAVSSIPRRRQRIFDESEGKCHYCATALTLDGKWHIEHKMPKALGGGNEPGNLVASCAPCNHKKRDKTDVEFMAQRAKEAA